MLKFEKRLLIPMGMSMSRRRIPQVVIGRMDKEGELEIKGMTT